MDNPAGSSNLETRGFPVTEANTDTVQVRLDEAWRALQLEVPSLVARLEAGTLPVAAVVDVICAGAYRVLRNPEGNESGSGQLDDYSESWKRADATQDLYFTAAELRRLSPPAFQNAGSFKYS